MVFTGSRWHTWLKTQTMDLSADNGSRQWVQRGAQRGWVHRLPPRPPHPPTPSFRSSFSLIILSLTSNNVHSLRSTPPQMQITQSKKKFKEIFLGLEYGLSLTCNPFSLPPFLKGPLTLTDNSFHLYYLNLQTPQIYKKKKMLIRRHTRTILYKR